MGSVLRVRRVRLENASPRHSWEFPDGVTVIVGSVGGGKTSLLNLIQWGLGMKAPIIDEVKQASDGVTVEIDAGGHGWRLTRRYGQNRVTVINANANATEPAQAYTTAQSTKLPSLSDWLLKQIGIPAVRVRQSRTGASNRVTRISFADVFAYCYLDQDQVDRSTVYDNDAFRGPKRASTFELLYGIIDKRIADLEVEQLELKSARDQRESRIRTVEDFLRDKGLQITADAVDTRLTEVLDQQYRLDRALIEARANSDRAAQALAEMPDTISDTQTRLTAAQGQLADVTRELDGVRRAANQLQRDLQAVSDGSDAQSALSSFPFVVCPRCEQRLDTRAHAVDRCVVCLLPDPPPATSNEAEDRHDQLTRQLGETRAIEDQLTRLRESISQQISTLRIELKHRRAELDAMVKAATEPHRQAASEVLEQLGALRAERTVLTNALPVARGIRQEQVEISEIAPHVAVLEDEEERHRDALEPARERVDELSHEFDLILRRFTLPWLHTAEVDRSTYLPRVNGRGLRELSSGGMKATTNVAYYLANLVMALRDREILTPSFLMLDSIRKDYGAGEKDLARADRIYSYLETLQISRRNPGALAADFQLIVVDNDLPADYDSAFNTIRIDPDQPLIRSS